MVESLIKFTNTKFYRSIIASAFAAGLLYLVCGFSFFVFDWVAKLAGLEEPAWAASTRSTLQIVLTILAGVLGFISGSGVLNNTFLGKFFYYAGRTALARGLFGQFLVFALIYFPMREVRTIPQINEGLPATGEAGMVLGGLLSVLGFLFFSGTLTGYMRTWFGLAAPLHHGAPEGEPEWLRYFCIDVNHKVIGIQYAVTAVLVLLVGGIAAILFRLELAIPGMQLFTSDQYNTLFSAHGMIMIASVFLGIGALINYLAPVMVGASDMAFPRLNAFSYWISVPAATLLIAGMFLGWDTGWVGYPPHSTSTQMIGVVLFLLGFYINGFSSIAGGINLLVTVSTMRAKGMDVWRMPIFVWTAIATAIMQFTATQTVGVALSMVIAQRVLGMSFFDPSTSPPGDPVLYQHLFWFYSHPAVYMWVVPGFGLISELLPVFARKPLFGYRWVALSSMAIALLGFIVWAHHMFTSGMSDALRIPFMIATMFVGVPTGVKFFSWLGTLWGGKISYPTPMLFMLGAISVFLLGGLSGPILATVPTDMHLHDSYWVVGHFHATVFGGYIFPFFGALYYWFPKVTGRMYNERLGKLHFWLILPAFWVMSLGQMQVGLLGMRRRIADYDQALGISFAQSLVTIATLVIGWSVLIMMYNLWTSSRSGVVSAENPWRSRSPEWLAPTPLPEFNFLSPIEVVGEPYEYGLAHEEAYVRAIPTPSMGD